MLVCYKQTLSFQMQMSITTLPVVTWTKSKRQSIDQHSANQRKVLELVVTLFSRWKSTSSKSGQFEFSNRSTVWKLLTIYREHLAVIHTSSTFACPLELIRNVCLPVPRLLLPFFPLAWLTKAEKMKKISNQIYWTLIFLAATELLIKKHFCDSKQLAAKELKFVWNYLMPILAGYHWLV